MRKTGDWLVLPSTGIEIDAPLLFILKRRKRHLASKCTTGLFERVENDVGKGQENEERVAFGFTGKPKSSGT